jgi:hypothetical protein
VPFQRQSVARPVCVDLPSNDREASYTYRSCCGCKNSPDSIAAASLSTAHLAEDDQSLSLSLYHLSLLPASQHEAIADPRLGGGVHSVMQHAMQKITALAPKHHADMAWPVAEGQQPQVAACQSLCRVLRRTDLDMVSCSSSGAAQAKAPLRRAAIRQPMTCMRTCTAFKMVTVEL